MNEHTDEQHWQAVLNRDARFDGVFVYAVSSTGIYCRPSCPSRRPRREGVRFFADARDAEQARFRACKRCRPGKADPERLDESLTRRACAAIDAAEGTPLTLTALGATLGVSPGHLQRTFTRTLGITPRQYAAARRAGEVKERLRTGDSIAGALYDAGYGSSSRLYEGASATLGMTPAAYRRGGKGMRISYTIAASQLGRLLVAATPRGVCAVSLGDADTDLEAGLRREYPAAAIGRDDEGLGVWLAAILDHLDGRLPVLNLPLDLQGTAFQWRVRALLQAIPYGETRSYGELARELGNPGAARAVARVCATNPVALAIPCHRVVRGDGDEGGYRWGVQRKHALLAREQEHAEAPSVARAG
jgi:AraC family transcriptional regulator of adaptative response/methylated-DNA-[protein]-cysteine methyltransferase